MLQEDPRAHRSLWGELHFHGLMKRHSRHQASPGNSPFLGDGQKAFHPPPWGQPLQWGRGQQTPASVSAREAAGDWPVIPGSGALKAFPHLEFRGASSWVEGGRPWEWECGSRQPPAAGQLQGTTWQGEACTCRRQAPVQHPCFSASRRAAMKCCPWAKAGHGPRDCPRSGLVFRPVWRRKAGLLVYQRSEVCGKRRGGICFASWSIQYARRQGTVQPASKQGS